MILLNYHHISEVDQLGFHSSLECLDQRAYVDLASSNSDGKNGISTITSIVALPNF
jgi:hypothetical protein